MKDFLELCAERFSARLFTDAPVSEADLQYVLEAVRLAPSAVNRQPWRWLVVGSDEGRAKVQRCYDRPWFQTAPIYIIGMKDTSTEWVRPCDQKRHGDVDLAIAAEHLCLAATERGLGTCPSPRDGNLWSSCRWATSRPTVRAASGSASLWPKSWKGFRKHRLPRKFR